LGMESIDNSFMSEYGYTSCGTFNEYSCCCKPKDDPEDRIIDQEDEGISISLMNY